MLEPGLAVSGPGKHDGAPPTARARAGAAETVLERVLDSRLRQARDTDEVFARDVAERVVAFVRQGGKRLRTAFAWCGWRAAGGSGDATEVLRVGAALELLQACALIHDDLMDGSVLRRGAPAVHVDLARTHREAAMSGSAESFGTSGALLAGDLALAWADDLLAETALGSPCGPRLYGEWRAMRTEMVAGQYRDLHAQASGSSGVDEALTIATLKSAQYTAARPLGLGASLAGADDSTLSALHAAGRCAGIAFQLRDDLLGAFGDPALTGKPTDDDLHSRKPTYLLAVALRLADTTGDHDAAAVLAPRADSRTEPVEPMREALERTGARAAAEAKIGELATAALRHFDAMGADAAARREFAALLERATGHVGAPQTGERV
ncbi:geranylgeranyl pyrophosphate synthase [Streptomyces venezuelae]|uniref:Geranylgeranyl pyrophosphate synthase n=1 Tax=Streptomyces venezuelae TaxID=54571 RepID=A0A5P2CWG7_STRVZ|nr:polyprenyl synthetase family protein [Streptomyces venezuelae]QES46620.1 geranylgeranyl pyrophosphate synthase [Streptomyces venezuelae]